jgi:hypothetical protein
MDYLSSPVLNNDELEYATAVLGLSESLSEIIAGGLVHWVWLEQSNGLDRITLTYYTDKDTFDRWNNSAPHTVFLNTRSTFLSKTGITLQVVAKESADDSDSDSYDIANQLFS